VYKFYQFYNIDQDRPKLKTKALGSLVHPKIVNSQAAVQILAITALSAAKLLV